MSLSFSARFRSSSTLRLSPFRSSTTDLCRYPRFVSCSPPATQFTASFNLATSSPYLFFSRQSLAARYCAAPAKWWCFAPMWCIHAELMASLLTASSPAASYKSDTSAASFAITPSLYPSMTARCQ